MATSSAYRAGNIYSIVTAGSETLGSGGRLLNHNFTELYDMVRPTHYIEGSLVDVPTTYEFSNTPYKAKVMALAYGGSLDTYKDYVPTFTPTGSGFGAVRWKEYNGNANNGSDNNGSDNNDSVEDPSIEELKYKYSRYEDYYYASSDWHSGGSYLTPIQKTYKHVTQDNTVEIALPNFGVWLVTGTMVILETADTDYSPSIAHLLRVNIIGKDLYIKSKICEIYNGSAWINHDKLIATINNGTLKLRDNTSFSYETILHDLTLITGGGARIAYGGSSDLSVNAVGLGSDDNENGTFSSNGYDTGSSSGGDDYGSSSDYYDYGSS